MAQAPEEYRRQSLAYRYPFTSIVKIIVSGVLSKAIYQEVKAMISLYELMREIFIDDGIYEENKSKFLKYNVDNDFDAMLKNTELCKEIIRSYIGIDDVDYKIDMGNKYRIKHIIITWLLGIGIGRFNRLSTPDDKLISHFRLWMISALSHDYGYFCDETKRPSSNFLDSFGNNYLLKDDYDGELKVISGFSKKHREYYPYSYDEIEKYYLFSLEYRKDKPYEKADHGIVGGCKFFNKYANFLEKKKPILTDGEILKTVYKAACLNTASHNIFKSESDERDREYESFGLTRICKNAPPVITKQYKLLLLMSIVDTIEPTKKYVQFIERRTTNLLMTDTVLKNIQVEVSEDDITIDFQKLYAYIKNSRNEKKDVAKERTDDIKSGVLKLSNWTCLKTKEVDDRIIISI